VEEESKTPDGLVPPPAVSSSPESAWEASGNLRGVLKEFTDLQIEENPEEGQDAEGGSAALNSSLLYNSCCYPIKNISVPFIPTLSLNLILAGQSK